MSQAEMTTEEMAVWLDELSRMRSMIAGVVPGGDPCPAIAARLRELQSIVDKKMSVLQLGALGYALKELRDLGTYDAQRDLYWFSVSEREAAWARLQRFGIDPNTKRHRSEDEAAEAAKEASDGE